MHHCGPLLVHQFACLSDNYGFLVRDEATGTVATIDTPDAKAITEEAEKLGWSLDLVLNTHWHPDHAGGNAELADRFGCKIIAPADEGDKIAVKDEVVQDGAEVRIGDTALQVIGVPGHTLGHIAYYAAEARLAFVGDALFSLGCGRMFEGTPDVFWASILKLRGLPEETMMFCAHEYTRANADFALSVDPNNAQLLARSDEIDRLRADGLPTVPVILADELPINPFLRADDTAFASSMGKAGAAAHEVFAEVRSRKDRF